jgi:hypothetical protein
VGSRNKKPSASIGGPDFVRGEKQRRRKVEAHVSKLAVDGAEVLEERGHVFEEDVCGLDLLDDPDEVRPEGAFVRITEARARVRVRLAGETRSDDIHEATPRLAVEGCDIVPDRSRHQGRVFHPRHEDGRSVGFPLDMTHSSETSDPPSQPDLEPTNPGA